MSDARVHALNILIQFWNKNIQFDSLIDQYFSKNKLDRKTELHAIILAKDVVKFTGRLDAWMKPFVRKKLKRMNSVTKIILEIGIYELLMDEKVPAYAAINSAVNMAKKRISKKTGGFVNAVLQNINRTVKVNQKHDMADHEWASFPKHLIVKWNQNFGKLKTADLYNYYNRVSPLTIRLNPKAISIDEFKKIMEDTSIQYENAYDNDIFFRILTGSHALLNSSQFKTGKISFQDRAAGAVVEILNPIPGDIVLDVCAAPGTKAYYCSELMDNNGTVYASDSDIDRVEKGKKDTKRHPGNNVRWVVKNAINSTYPIADKILVDVPCSGTGTIAKKPDIRWRRNQNDYAEFQVLQLQILKNVSKYLNENGTLVYATCSIEKEENWEVVEAFLKFNDNFKVDPITIPCLKKYIDNKGGFFSFPPTHKTDGMFAVKLIKRN